MAHRVYEAIVSAVKTGRLREPFSRREFRTCCPGFGAGTYNAFLDKHARGNPSGASELFEGLARALSVPPPIQVWPRER